MWGQEEPTQLLVLGQAKAGRRNSTQASSVDGKDAPSWAISHSLWRSALARSQESNSGTPGWNAGISADVFTDQLPIPSLWSLFSLRFNLVSCWKKAIPGNQWESTLYLCNKWRMEYIYIYIWKIYKHNVEEKLQGENINVIIPLSTIWKTYKLVPYIVCECTSCRIKKLDYPYIKLRYWLNLMIEVGNGPGDVNRGQLCVALFY